MRKWLVAGIATIVLIVLYSQLASAQNKYQGLGGVNRPFHAAFYQALKWRSIGPYQGGRSVVAVGLPNNPMVYYFGSTGGGLWKTEDAGWSWHNISDGFFQSSSVGAIAIAPSDPNVIYVGMGEHAVRGVMTSSGDGIYKSVDGGKTWEHMGLVQSEHIADICVHPTDPDQIYVAVQGALYKDCKERGVYHSVDGGRTWKNILASNASTGATDLVMDPKNPRILYASMWDHQRNPWYVRSGGVGSGLYKSMDGGQSWEKLSKGLPQSMGKAGICVAPSNPERLYAVVEYEEGGIFRSDDAGNSWEQVSKDRQTFARAWYFNKIAVDPKNQDILYVLNIPLLKSMDAGKSFVVLNSPHADQHDLWINPNNPQNMILANDGGACISFNGGKSWTSQNNQATGQFYRITCDNGFPYHIYTAQQDYGAMGIPSRVSGSEVLGNNWYQVAGGESAFLALDPNNPEWVYGTNYQGNISAWHRPTETSKDIMAYPEIALATRPRDLKYRFNWNAPLVSSPQNPKILYHGAQKVLKTENGGISWEAISPDLTRNDPNHQIEGGGPFLNEGAGAENYNTISYIAPSPHKAGVIWVGTDDGRVHFTRNEGGSWEDRTPKGLPEGLINSIEVSPHDPNTIYIVACRYRFGDRQPYVYRSTDNGRNWEKITVGFGINDFVRVVREDPGQKDLLYAGTESGFFISINGGENWHPFQLNLPVCPITDIQIHDNDLIASTAGRGIWVLDDLACFHHNQTITGKSGIALCPPKNAYRFAGEQQEDPTLGASISNSGEGMTISFLLPDEIDSLILEIRNSKGKVMRKYTSWTDASQNNSAELGQSILPHQKGLNRLVWDLRRSMLPGIPDLFIMGDLRGSMVPPGEYSIVLLCAADTVEVKANVLANPKIVGTPEDYKLQSIKLEEMESTIREMHRLISNRREWRNWLTGLLDLYENSTEHSDMVATARDIIAKINEWEKGLTQPAHQGTQDAIVFKHGLHSELLDLKARTDALDPRITQGVTDRFNDIRKVWFRKKPANEAINQAMLSFMSSFKEKEMAPFFAPPTNTY